MKEQLPDWKYLIISFDCFVHTVIWKAAVVGGVIINVSIPLTIVGKYDTHDICGTYFWQYSRNPKKKKKKDLSTSHKVVLVGYAGSVNIFNVSLNFACDVFAHYSNLAMRMTVTLNNHCAKVHITRKFHFRLAQWTQK